MKLMYLTFQEDAMLYVGVVRKIRWQVRAFEQLGYDVTYSLFRGNEYCFTTGDQTEVKKIAGRRGLMKRFARVAEDYLSSHRFDVLYIRLDRISFDIIRICRIARKNGAQHVIIELPNYPYLTDYINSVQDIPQFTKCALQRCRVLGFAAEDRLSGLFLRGLVDAVILIGNHADSFFGVKAMNISNGIDVDAMQPVPQKKNPDEIVLVGVAGTLWWQAYDRILEGMYHYKKANPGRLPRIRFILVGGDAKEMPDFHALVKKYGLEDDVECPGFKTGKELDEIYSRADLGVSKLGCYRRGLQSCSSLKAREYCAKGLPYIYTCEDSLENQKVKFALQVPNDSTPVDMESVVKFMQECRSDPNLPLAEHQFAKEHYDWTAIMKRVLEFANAHVEDIN